MACGNCANCGDSSKGASQRSLVAYIQPCGAGPAKDALNAMTDGGYGSAIKVTGGTRQIRGSRTAKRRRLSDGSSKLCYYTESSPGENTVNLEFAQCGCGGYSAEELAAEGTFDLYQMQACCGSADMGGGWSKMHVMRCISFNSLSFSDQSSYDPDDDGDLVHTFDANYVEDYYVYPVSMSNVLDSTVIDAGARIDSLVYRSKTKGCTQSCKDDCAGNWYSVTNEGRVIYRNGSDKPISSVSIPGYVASNGARIGMVGDRLVVTGNGGYYTATVDSYGIPGTWTFVASSIATDGVVSADDGVYLYGNNGGSYGIVRVDENGSQTNVFTNNTGTVLGGFDSCGSKMAAAGSGGNVFIGSGCGSLSATPVDPTIQTISAVRIQPGGNVWVGSGTGEVFWTDDDGNSWNQVNLPGGVGSIADIKWVDAGVGYIVANSPTSIFTTEDGGNTWSKADSANRISSPIGGASSLRSVEIPCCTSKTKSVNTFTVTGVTSAAAGAIWQSSYGGNC